MESTLSFINQKVMLKSGKLIRIESINEIMYIQMHDSLIEVFLINKKSYFIDNTLSELEDKFHNHMFFRVNRQVIINLMYLKAINLNNSASIILDNNLELQVSRRRIGELMKKMEIIKLN